MNNEDINNKKVSFLKGKRDFGELQDEHLWKGKGERKKGEV
jgi:hypothetical protein